MNDWLILLNLQAWKPALKALAMPPVPLMLLALLGAWQVQRRPRLARALVLGSVLGLWLVCCSGTGRILLEGLNPAPPPLTAEQIRRLAGAPHTAILVLGAGRKALAPEYGGPDLRPLTVERLRYGHWLARQTGLPWGFSGGVSHSTNAGATEADAAQLALQRDGGLPLRWREGRSRDTDENARYSVAMLGADGIRQLVLVTHGFHQPRALAAFQRAIGRAGIDMVLVPAPMGLLPPMRPAVGDWLPSGEGLQITRWALNEWLGRLAGA